MAAHGSRDAYLYVREGEKEREPEPGISYVAFCDPDLEVMQLFVRNELLSPAHIQGKAN